MDADTLVLISVAALVIVGFFLLFSFLF